MRNVYSNCYNDEECIYVYLCDDAKVVGNQILNVNYAVYCGISHMNYDGYGIETSGSATGVGTAVVEDNTVVNSVGDGFYHSGDGVIFRRNDCTISAEDGFHVSGDNNTIERCNARSVYGDGFYITGGGNTLSRCSATDCDKDGFDIGSGAGNSLNLCRATNCAGEGLDNGGTATTATNCTLRRSRIDYAGAGNMASDAGTTFTTGGAGIVGEID
ncbi:MAG: right-handed parallel beta-helix repeat-containing protein [Planctomycetota bacterium]